MPSVPDQIVVGVPVQPLMSYIEGVFLWEKLVRFGFPDERSTIEKV